MTRAAAREGFEEFVGEAFEAVVAEFDVGAALRGTRGPGSGAIDALLSNSETLDRRVVRPQLREYEEQTLAQFDAVLDYAEDGGDVEEYADAILAHDTYWAALDPDVPAERRAAVRADLLDRHRRLGEAVRPVVESPATSFWPAVTREFSLAETERLVAEQFAFTGPALDHRDALAFEVTLDPADVLPGPLGRGTPGLTVEFTDEALRAMCRAERQVVRSATREARRRFAD